MIHYYDLPEPITRNNNRTLAGNLQRFHVSGDICDVKRILSMDNTQRRDRHIDNYTEPGLYIVNFYGDPHLWFGLRTDTPVEGQTENPSFLDVMDSKVLDMVRSKKLRIAIFGGVEGNCWINCTELEEIVRSLDAFLALHIAMKKHNLPPLSIAIACGDLNAKQKYEDWLIKNNTERMFEFHDHVGSFQNHARTDTHEKNTIPIAFSSHKHPKTRAYNSLNRVWKPHRGAHLYLLSLLNILNDGHVSCNEVCIDFDEISQILSKVNPNTVHTYMKHYPKFLDGKFANANKADHIFTSIYYQSQLSVVTESLYMEKNNVFMSEKTWKPIYVGHPFIMISSNGHLKELRRLGYRTDFVGIDDSYDEIEDPEKRMLAAHDTLRKWTRFSKEQRMACIFNSGDALVHNMKHFRETNHFLNTINNIEETSTRYFNDKI